MNIARLPTSNEVGVLPGLVTSLEKRLDDTTEATRKQQVVAWAVASVGSFVFAAVDEVMNAALMVLKAVPVLANVTVGKLTGLSKHFPASLTAEDLRGHWDNISRSIVIQLNALAVFLTLQKPQMVVNVARDINLFRTDVPADKQDAGSVAAVTTE